MSIYPIWMWFKNLVMLPSNLAKIASINEQFKLQKELSETQQRLKKAEQQLAKEAAIKKGRMFFANNVIWSKDDNGEIEKIPYCPRCFELDGKVVHLVVWYSPASKSNAAKCPECKVDDILFRIPE